MPPKCRGVEEQIGTKQNYSKYFIIISQYINKVDFASGKRGLCASKFCVKLC